MTLLELRHIPMPFSFSTETLSYTTPYNSTHEPSDALLFALDEAHKGCVNAVRVTRKGNDTMRGLVLVYIVQKHSPLKHTAFLAHFDAVALRHTGRLRASGAETETFEYRSGGLQGEQITSNSPQSRNNGSCSLEYFRACKSDEK